MIKPSSSAEQYYIVSRSPSASDYGLVLKQDDTFALLDRHGDILGGTDGLYHKGTRFLSHFEMLLDGDRFTLLSSNLKRDNVIATADLTNPDLFREGRLAVPRGTLHISRFIFLWDGVCHVRLRVYNFGDFPVRLTIGLEYAADFADIFEVRGTKRARRGEYLPVKLDANSAALAYRGLDQAVRTSRLEFWPAPQSINHERALYDAEFYPRGQQNLEFRITCEDSVGAKVGETGFDRALTLATAQMSAEAERECQISTDFEPFNQWIARSSADLRMMLTRTERGIYPYAGVPWFSTIFGRDGIITALATLWINPEIARGVLNGLATTQAMAADPAREAQPGKIVHEMRSGEMAALGEIPFGQYYGSVDATPLFVMLAAAYVMHTGQESFGREIWPHVERALEIGRAHV